MDHIHNLFQNLKIVPRTPHMNIILKKAESKVEGRKEQWMKVEVVKARRIPAPFHDLNAIQLLC
ncbi:unnamed protein product [Lupinus luteus]|uniref:Uncharacterized protein n=1 Tax=Lupinus luteus TaxID=3873 RepID=A0AAV1X7I1_LUPLU